MKRVCSFFMAVLLCCSLVAQAFAATLTPLTEENTVAPGQKIVVTATVDQGYEDIILLETRMYFDSNLFTFDSAGTTDVAAGWNVAKNPITDKDTGKTYVKISIANMSAAGTSEAGVVAKLSFTANDTITEETATSFIGKFMGGATADADVGEGEEKSTPVTVTPAPRYAVNASGPSNSITVGETAQVALKISNSDETIKTYNAYYMEVSYNTSVLAYKSINTDASVTDNNGILKIADYGKDKTCGTDNIVLTFTGRTTGEAKVTVTSAKVDVKANAAEKDAPTATITTGAATITVGGYQVTLHEAFTGKSTANHGQDYTFNAKDPSKKYDFTGSTMGGSDVTVTDNGNGTYTVENVTGPLVIKATEKVTINLSGDAMDTITTKSWGDATEVDAGKALWFTAAPNGKELVVTVNDEVVAGKNMQAFMRYDIDAKKVTGTELNIVVSYKSSTDTITIIETGDAWSDVTLRGTWSADDGAIDMSTAGAIYTLKFKPAAGKTVDDYVVTINGTKMELKNMRRGEWGVNFVPNEVAVAGKITIDVSYKKTGPAITVDVSEYLNLSGKTMFLITASCTDLAEGKVLAYNGNAMYWSEKYNAYAWLEIAADSLETVKAAVTTDKFTVIDATGSNKISIAYNGDVNLTNAADINDAQLVWNMYNAEYKADTDFQTVNRLKYLSADMNGDKTVDTSDAAAIVNMIVGNGN